MAAAPDDLSALDPANHTANHQLGVLEVLPHTTQTNTAASTGYVDVEKRTEPGLRKAADAIPGRAWLVMLLTMAERFSFYGMAAPLMNFMQNSRNDQLRPGALGWGQAKAAQISNVFYIMTLITPIAAALVADRRLGRYKVLSITFFIYLTGSTLLFISSLAAVADHATGIFVTALVFIAVGMSGVNGLLAAFVGDQYTTEDGAIVTTRQGERIIVDRARTIESIYNAYYWCINVGGLSGIATTALELYAGFWVAFLLPLCALSLSAAILLLAKNRLVVVPAQPSALPDALRAMWLAACSGFSLDQARPSVQQHKHNRHVRWTAAFVVEVQTALKACRILLSTWPILWLCRGQISNNLVAQAAQMQTSGVPNDMMYNANPIIIIIFMPVVDRLLFPRLRRAGFTLSAVTRLVFGFALEGLAMAMAAIVQKVVYDTGPCYDRPLRCDASADGTIPNSVSVFLQVPIYVLEAASEILSSPAGYELAFSMAPASMKSVMQSVFSTTGAIGSALSIAISPAYENPNMTWVYAALALAMAAVTVLFYLVWGRSLKRDVPDDESSPEGEPDVGTGTDLNIGSDVKREETKKE